MIHLLRHAHAGKRGSHDPDENRPLSKRGLVQADLVAARLAAQTPSVIYTSPFLRCVQTADAVARESGASIELAPILADGRPSEPVLDLLASADGIVVCSHGDVLEGVLAALGVRGVGGGPVIGKGACWDLVLDGMTVVAATYHPAPA